MRRAIESGSSFYRAGHFRRVCIIAVQIESKSVTAAAAAAAAAAAVFGVCRSTLPR